MIDFSKKEITVQQRIVTFYELAGSGRFIVQVYLNSSEPKIRAYSKIGSDPEVPAGLFMSEIVAYVKRAEQELAK